MTDSLERREDVQAKNFQKYCGGLAQRENLE
jgi:hypothetical protein